LITQVFVVSNINSTTLKRCAKFAGVGMGW
jgi:hypothetical protein